MREKNQIHSLSLPRRQCTYVFHNQIKPFSFALINYSLTWTGISFWILIWTWTLIWIWIEIWIETWTWIEIESDVYAGIEIDASSEIETQIHFWN